MSRRWWIVGGCLAVAVAAIAIPLLMALDAGVSNATKGSIAYRTKLPEAIKAVPIIAECQPPLYDTIERPDQGVEFATVSYTTVASAEDATKALEDYFIGRGCDAVVDQLFGPGFACPDRTQGFVSVRDHEVCPFVAVAIVPVP